MLCKSVLGFSFSEGIPLHATFLTADFLHGKCRLLINDKVNQMNEVC